MAEDDIENGGEDLDEPTEDGLADDLEADDGEEGSGKKGGKGKLIAIVAVALLVVIGGAGGGLYLLGFLDSLLGIEQADELADDAIMKPGGDPLDLGVPVYHEMPEFVADLKTGKCRSPYLKLALTIQIDQADQEVLIDRQPKIIDRILRHLREQERQNLMGADGAEELRTGIILIVNGTIKPAKVQNVLFRSMILQ